MEPSGTHGAVDPPPISIRKNLAGTVAVFAGLVLITLGPALLYTVLPAQRPLPDGRPLALGALPVTVVPPQDALLDAEGTKPEADTVQLVVGSIQYRLHAEAFDGSLEELARQTREAVARTDGVQIVEDERDARTRQGVAGRQAGFTQAKGPGRYVVFLADGIAVKAYVSAGDPGLRPIGEDIDASIASIAIMDRP